MALAHMPISLHTRTIRRLLLTVVLLAGSGTAGAETGQAAWLRYARLDAATADRNMSVVPRSILTVGSSAPVQKAGEELLAGIRGMLAVEPKRVTQLPADGAIVAGTLTDLRQAHPGLLLEGVLPTDGF